MYSCTYVLFITILFHVTAGLEFIRVHQEAYCKIHLMYYLHHLGSKRLSAEVTYRFQSSLLSWIIIIALCMPHKLSATLLSLLSAIVILFYLYPRRTIIPRPRYSLNEPHYYKMPQAHNTLASSHHAVPYQFRSSTVAMMTLLDCPAVSCWTEWTEKPFTSPTTRVMTGHLHC